MKHTKRLLALLLSLALAFGLAMPAAAIINLDGTEPDWDGDPRIRPLSGEIDPGENDDFLTGFLFYRFPVIPPFLLRMASKLQSFLDRLNVSPRAQSAINHTLSVLLMPLFYFIIYFYNK